ncbi:MAG: ATP-binding protein [Gammaproteobacteria bacterium]
MSALPPRPDPDALLAAIAADETRATRGRLKIFFGASPGVGKTYAMLSAARAIEAQGVDVVVGVVETHGRSETAALLDGLERLPPRRLEHRGRWLEEFDLEGALARRPSLILVDELAHSNAPGSRHAKRWQDVEDLLSAGIDVYTTVNVQHLESLNNAVGGITGARVWETVPDGVFDAANEVVLVDLPHEELLTRLKEGKVYIPEQAERAMQNFFRKGNLLALRELALRRTAERVDSDVLAYRREQAVDTVWRTQDSILLCIGPTSGQERLVRSAARMAAQSHVPWHVIYVETPALQRLPTEERARILHTLRLAHDLGATTASLADVDAVDTARRYAREHNLGRVLVGRGTRRWAPWRRGFAARLAASAPDLDVLSVASEGVSRDREQPAPRAAWRTDGADWRAYAGAVGCVLLLTVLTAPFHARVGLINSAMLQLLVAVLAAYLFGPRPGLLAAVASVASFDLFYVPPRFSFAVSDVQYAVTFVVMLGVSLLVGQLTARQRFQARIAGEREQRMRALFEMARELTSALTLEQTADIGQRFVARLFDAAPALLVMNDVDRLEAAPGGALPAEVDLSVAQWALDHNAAAGRSTDTLPAATALYLPLRAPMRTRGVLALVPRREDWLLSPEQQRLLDTTAALIAIALERIHFIAVAQDAVVHMESERLRNSLLAALSHDLKTPLTALAGLADSLHLAGPPLAPAQTEIAVSIREEALRTSTMVMNLLEMARLQSGDVRLQREWQPLEEVIGGALRARAAMLAHHTVHVDLPADLPLVEFDSLLMERVFCNLLENAAKYTPSGSTIEIAAANRGDWIEITVADNGPGLPAGREHLLFEKFSRGQETSTVGGVGLGLSIVRAVLEAHGGQVSAANRASGGAVITLRLPAGTPPMSPGEEV